MTAVIGDNEFQCDSCGGIFTKGWSDEESLAEAETNGHPATGDDGVICDDCYPAFMAWFTRRRG